MKVTKGQIVMVQVSRGSVDSEWVPGAVLEVGNVRGIYGYLAAVFIGPEKEGKSEIVRRYTAASRVRPSTLGESLSYVSANREYLKRNLGGDALASLTTRMSTLDAQAQNQPDNGATMNDVSQVQTVNLRVTKGGEHTKLAETPFRAILAHPQIQDEVQKACKEAKEDTERMLDACCKEKDELLSKLVNLTKRYDTQTTKLEESTLNLRQAVESVRRLIRERDQRATEGLKSDFQPNAMSDADFRYNMSLSQLKAAGTVTGRATSETIRPEADVMHDAGTRRGYVLWCPTSNQPPRVKYKTYEEAKKVQASMARTYKGQEFYILPIGPGLKVSVPTKETVVQL